LETLEEVVFPPVVVYMDQGPRYYFITKLKTVLKNIHYKVVIYFI